MRRQLCSTGHQVPSGHTVPAGLATLLAWVIGTECEEPWWRRQRVRGMQCREPGAQWPPKTTRWLLVRAGGLSHGLGAARLNCLGQTLKHPQIPPQGCRALSGGDVQQALTAWAGKGTRHRHVCFPRRAPAQPGGCWWAGPFPLTGPVGGPALPGAPATGQETPELRQFLPIFGWGVLPWCIDQGLPPSTQSSGQGVLFTPRQWAQAAPEGTKGLDPPLPPHEGRASAPGGGGLTTDSWQRGVGQQMRQAGQLITARFCKASARDLGYDNAPARPSPGSSSRPQERLPPHPQPREQLRPCSVVPAGALARDPASSLHAGQSGWL